MTNEQLLLPGMDFRETASSIDNLFIGFFPDGLHAKRTADLGVELGKLQGLHGKFRRADLLHITLCKIGTYRNGLREDHLNAAKQVCGNVAAVSCPIEIHFDRVMTFQGGEGRHPFVLCGHDHDPELHAIHDLLLRGLVKLGLPIGANSNFNPHLTLAYAKERMHEVPVKPIRWTAGELCLVHSLVGKSQYRILGRWPLFG
ncbi:2'-5' RNA ligase family protein [Haloferula sp. BvORR071]|uniref:2'-5' RNA ligase family protein n=1 Tax=Haloferula sp. BvORR071 TaxID=1396141 RepID=UPI00055011A4|nr:2'-5' RNA ligase family protein [Haloferula sp. BvORR071]